MQGPPLNAFAVMQILAVSVALWLVFTQPIPWDLQREIGAALVVAGVAGIASARYQLGKSFSLRAEARELVTGGVYSKIRNPIYVFGLLMVAGIVLALHRPMLWILVPIIAIMQTLRARREAQVLEAAFGDAYREYRRKTWF
jgi:protein-S-isoprenylcysteine O-methyltransferase Ste14